MKLKKLTNFNFVVRFLLIGILVQNVSSYGFSKNGTLELTNILQEEKITGKVTSGDDQQPLPGVSILLKGTFIGTSTDLNGTFTMMAPQDGILELSYVGYKTMEIPINNQTIFEIEMEPDLEQLEEIIVVGYGTVKKSDATGSVAVIDSESFNKGVTNSAQDLIAGKTAGVSVTSISGAPGNSSTIRIRGGASMSASNDPLIVIDGVPIDNSTMGGSPNILSTLNPNDIETFTVLKDASATAIYGSRASNGVILITTKRGSQQFKVNYKATASVYTNPNQVEVYSGDEYRALMNDIFVGEEAVLSLLGDANKDWQNEIFQTAFGQDHNLSLSGTYKNMPYRVSLGYNNTDGVLKTYNYERTTLSIGLDPSFLNDHLKVKLNVKGLLNNNNFADQSAVFNAVSYDPTKPVRNGNTRWRGYTTWTTGGINGTGINLATPNPVAQLELTDNTSVSKRSLGNAQFDYKFHFLPELHANLNLGYDYAKTEGQNNVPDNTQWVYNPTVAGGRINPYWDQRENQLLDFYLNYTKDLTGIESKIDAMAGYSWSHFSRASGDSLTNYAGSEAVQSNEFESEYYLVSFFGRVNYSLKDKYVLTFTLRNDATSRFSDENRWGLFPAAAFAWRINEENFLKNSKTISDFKLRIGYGITGQQDLNNGNNYPYFAKYTISDNAARYQFGNSFYNTIRPDGYDANIKWETTTTSNIGIDYGFFNGRLNGSLDFYYRETEDLLNTVDVPVGTNFAARVLTNVGSMVNKGIEFNINANILTGDKFKWELGYNISYNENELTKLNLNDDLDYFVPVGNIFSTTSATGGTIQAQKVGHPVNSFYVYQQVYDTERDPIEDVFVDRNNDNIINSSDLYIYKKPAADVMMGVFSTLKYKKWDLFLSGRANFGNYVYNNVASNSTYSELYSSMQFIRNVSKQADETKFTSAINTRYSDFYIENASFFRMDNINLGYNMDDLFNQKLNLRLNLGIQNAFVITNYKGLDPEISGGLDNSFFPRSRVFLLGVNCEF